MKSCSSEPSATDQPIRKSAGPQKIRAYLRRQSQAARGETDFSESGREGAPDDRGVAPTGRSRIIQATESGRAILRDDTIRPE